MRPEYGTVHNEIPEHFAHHWSGTLINPDPLVFVDYIPGRDRSGSDSAISATPVEYVPYTIARLIAFVLRE